MNRQLLSFLITAPGVLEAQAVARQQIQTEIVLHQTCRADAPGSCLPAAGGASRCLKAHWPLSAPDCREGFIVIRAGAAETASPVGPKAN